MSVDLVDTPERRVLGRNDVTMIALRVDDEDALIATQLSYCRRVAGACGHVTPITRLRHTPGQLTLFWQPTFSRNTRNDRKSTCRFRVVVSHLQRCNL